MIKLDTMEEKAWTGQNQVSFAYSASSGLVLDESSRKSRSDDLRESVRGEAHILVGR